MKNRNIQIDVAKGLGIVLVVLGHNELVLNEKGELFRIIYSFHLPLFFLLAGVFIRENDTFWNVIRSRADSLLKPCFVVLTGLGIAKLAVEFVKTGRIELVSWGYFERMLIGTGETMAWVPLWFLPHLFLASCWTFLLIRFVKPIALRRLFTAASLAGGVWILSPSFGKNPWQTLPLSPSGFPVLPWSLDLLPITSAFVLLGFELRARLKSMRFHAGAFLSSLCLFSFLHYLFDQTIDLNLRRYDSFVFCTAQSLAGIYWCLSVSCRLACFDSFGRLMAYLGAGSIFILIFHIFIEVHVFDAVLGLTGNSFVSAVISFLAGVTMPLLVWELVKRSNVLGKLLLPTKQKVASGELLLPSTVVDRSHTAVEAPEIRR
jgi:fucose 4-O-acetylase-like acetyltransferase